MDHDGALDARDWIRRGPPEVVAVVRAAVTKEPAPKALQRALYRARLTTDDELTRLVGERCQDRDYANDFGKTLLRVE